MPHNGLLLTSISLRDGVFDLLDYHQERLHYSRWKCFGDTNAIDLAKALRKAEPPAAGWHKTRVLYRQAIERVEFQPYTPRSISSLRLVDATGIAYAHKYADRSAINQLFSRREGADDILMVRNGLICDASYANVALWDGDSWYTPHPPLLKGVRRDALLDSGHIYLRSIHWQDIMAFAKIRLFNALLDWDDAIELPTSAILPFVST